MLPIIVIWPKTSVECECKLDFVLHIIHTYIEIETVMDVDDDTGIDIQIACMGVLA